MTSLALPSMPELQLDYNSDDNEHHGNGDTEEVCVIDTLCILL